MHAPRPESLPATPNSVQRFAIPDLLPSLILCVTYKFTYLVYASKFIFEVDYKIAGLEIVTVVILKIAVFWSVTPYRLVLKH